MQEEGSAKLQKKAIFTFLTKKDVHLVVESLLANPFNYHMSQGGLLGRLSVVFTPE